MAQNLKTLVTEKLDKKWGNNKRKARKYNPNANAKNFIPIKTSKSKSFTFSFLSPSGTTIHPLEVPHSAYKIEKDNRIRFNPAWQKKIDKRNKLLKKGGNHG